MEAPPPALPPIERRRVRANGLEFAVATSEKQEQGGRLALCLHGFPECWRSWVHQFPALSELGYRVWAPDMRGYGETSRPGQTADYAIEKLVDDVSGLIEAAAAESVTLIGHDWGAIVAWYFAMRCPSELERLVIMNVPHPAAVGDSFSWRQMARSYYMFCFQLPWLPERVLGRMARRAIGDGLRRGMANPLSNLCAFSDRDGTGGVRSRMDACAADQAEETQTSPPSPLRAYRRIYRLPI